MNQKTLKLPEKPGKPKTHDEILYATRDPLYCAEQGVWFHPGVKTPCFLTPMVREWKNSGALVGA